ncbi:ABC transporter substrate-binding protein [Pseudomonas citronellolis]|uniref:ABC transporter substrate-binding protein n=1 Tax=Pseudomonas citronellolis TaxID=53408 RepID=UPI0023E3D0FC|nr:ABC transporter substrate-binding protein [Pseudomonas citronellolis]MDF3933111.1 ABC transporter substrate-binding protein [Pseudomonas citronellolis]
MPKPLSSALAVSLIALSTSALADLTVVSQGGANKDAQQQAYYAPYTAQTGTRIIADEFNGEMAKIKIQVDTGSVSWDVVELEMPELTRACDEGLLEEVGDDPAIAAMTPQLIKGAVHSCGAGIFVWSTVLAYNADKLKVAPTGWADFWDVKKYPGKRGLRKGPMYTMEYALMADGVANKDIYATLATKEGQDRAFRKLDEIKPYIQWWEAGAQPPQYLMSGDVVMSAVYNGRISAVQNESNLKVVWNGGIYDIEAFTIPKGAKNAAEGRKFIQFVLQTQQQKAYSDHIAYGPVNLAAAAELTPAQSQNLPSAPQNLEKQLAMDAGFWADHGEQLQQRFNAWAAR